jgi:hypothetical protein
MCIDVPRRALRADVAMKIGMAGVAVGVVGVQGEVGMRNGASRVCVLVAMRVHVCAGVTVRVGVHCVGVVVVSGPIRVGRIVVILIGIICVIAMAAVQVICVGQITVVVVWWGCAFVVVIAMLHIPVVFVRWMLIRGIQMARAGEVGMITVGGCVSVIPMERIIEVIGMPAVGVIIERKIAMRVGVIAMVGVGVAMTVEMRRCI